MKNYDDHNWDSYTSTYEAQLTKEVKGDANMDMIITDFSTENGELVFNDNLHTNWKEIYHQAYKLGVNSVFECGCGCAHHLINIKKTNPDMVVNGCDYAKSQINLGYRDYNLADYDFHERLKVVDMSQPDAVDYLGQHEFVYTQAVVMHLAHVKAKRFLRNMNKLASKYILMIEKPSSPYDHDWAVLIPEIFPEFTRLYDTKYRKDDGCILLERTHG